MTFEDYTLRYKEPVQAQRYHNYRAGLLSEGEIVVLYQDMIEANCVPTTHYFHAVHLVEMGLCHADGRCVQ